MPTTNYNIKVTGVPASAMTNNASNNALAPFRAKLDTIIPVAMDVEMEALRRVLALRVKNEVGTNEAIPSLTAVQKNAPTNVAPIKAAIESRVLSRLTPKTNTPAATQEALALATKYVDDQYIAALDVKSKPAVREQAIALRVGLITNQPSYQATLPADNAALGNLQSPTNFPTKSLRVIFK